LPAKTLQQVSVHGLLKRHEIAVFELPLRLPHGNPKTKGH
jgi:hypothetical protein